MYDYLIVGAGFFGSVFAHEMQKAGKKCLVIDKRDHIGGNCYTENIEGINVSKYGPHVFHTSSKKIWKYINQFDEFIPIKHSPKVFYKNKFYSFPINLFTFHQVYGINTPKEALKLLEEIKVPCKNPSNLEDWVLSQVGRDLYEIFFKGYTFKQWKKDPKELPASIVKRIPIRTNFDDSYFDDFYQGVPVEGYTKIFQKMLEKVEVKLNADYFGDKSSLDSISKKIVYTGPIDKFFDYKFGKLEYRSLRFEIETLDLKDYQGTACVNYTDIEVPFTRITEYKHFYNNKNDKTVISREYPESCGDPYYPINNDSNHQKHMSYKELSKEKTKYIFGGRLAEYAYYDMHQVIASSLNLAKKELSFR
jgi:UDP-galactopyranose mutase